MFGSCFVMQYLLSFIKFCNHLAEEEKVVCFTFIVFLMHVAVSVLCLFLAVPWVSMWSVIVAFLVILVYSLAFR